ncbi:MAG: hypothetical protein M0P01_02785 [Treponema sp.]|nr:hypothetical protein [Treponema sp.]
MFDDDDVPDREEHAFKSKKSTLLERKNWQGPEDADMLQEKQRGWRCNRDGSDGFDNAGGQEED